MNVLVLLVILKPSFNIIWSINLSISKSEGEGTLISINLLLKIEEILLNLLVIKMNLDLLFFIIQHNF